MQARSRRLRTLVIVLASLGTGLVAAQSPQQAQQAETPPVKGTGFMLGQVVDAGTNKPVPGATVNLGGGTAVTTTLSSGEVVITNSLPPGAPGAASTAPRQVLTEGNGRFLFREINQGTYTLRASATGYVAGLYGQYRPSGASQSIVIDRDDEKRTGLVIRLWKSATISGRIVDEFGEPAIGVTARLVRRTFSGGRSRLSSSSQATTDDRGVYRLTGIGPGDYLVGVFSTSTTLPAATADAYQQNASSGIGEEISREYMASGAPYPFTTGFRVGDFIFSGEGSFGRGGSGILPPPLDDGRVLAYPTVFYPTASTPQQATVIALGSGDDRAGIDFQLRLRRTVNISGFVTGPDGPMKNVGLKLLPAGAEEFTGLSGIEAAVTATDVSGAFTFLGVSPGTYTVQCIRVPRAQPPRSPSMTTVEVTGPNGTMMGVSTMGPTVTTTLPLPTDPTLWGGTSITVGESDIQGVGIVLRSGARLSGKMVFEGAGEPPSPEVLQRANISINSMTGTAPTQVTSAQKRIETDGTFRTMGYPPGRYSVSASLPPAPPGRGGGPAPASWRIKSATLGGKDLTDEGLEIQSADLAGIVLTFTDRPTEITGTVVDAKSQPDLAAMVVVVPADSVAWKNAIVSPARVRGVRTTSAGGFTLSNLPPGEYFIAAVSDASLDNWQDPKNLEAISRLATRITLGDGAKLSQHLTTVTIK